MLHIRSINVISVTVALQGYGQSMTLELNLAAFKGAICKFFAITTYPMSIAGKEHQS